MTTPARTQLATLMATTATDLLGSLEPKQRSKITFPFGDDEQFLWFYTPTDHGGLALGEMAPGQHRLTHRMLASGLSKAGYVTAAAIIGLENVLDLTEGWVTDFGRERGRDPLMYWMAIFGEPASGNWAWRFGGHHISINYLIVDGAVIGNTPSFFGADPADSPLLGPHLHRPLAGAEDYGRELVQSLDASQLKSALVSAVAPVDLVGVNRTELSEGDRPLGLPFVWRALDEETTAAWGIRQTAAEEKLGLTDEHLEAISFSKNPKGVAGTALGDDNKEILRALLSCYLDRLPDTIADEEHAKFAGDQIDSLSFMWAGGLERDEPHYYRIQGADLFVEYDNTQRDVNHIHTVWRDLRNDFGRDALAAHYATHKH
ncbi:MAG: hypothetical protein ACI81L_002523 [Verrucomicrobiales bacterium]|jgi:hypothetical protein